MKPEEQAKLKAGVQNVMRAANLTADDITPSFPSYGYMKRIGAI